MSQTEKTKEEFLEEIEKLKAENSILKTVHENDIQLHLKFSAALRESEKRYRLLSELTLEGIVIHKDFIPVDFNSTTEHILGYEREELLKTNLINLVHPEYKDKFLKYFENENSQNFEIRLQRKNGEFFFAEIKTRTISENNETFHVALITDITERKQAEEILVFSEELYRSILRASPDNITITDLKGKILMVSPAAVTMFGFENESHGIGHNVTEFIIPEDRENAMKNIALRAKGIRTGAVEYHGLKADGTVFDVEVNSDFIRDMKGSPNLIVIIVRDITKRKKAESDQLFLVEQLRYSNELIELNLYQKNALIEEISKAKDKLEKTNSEKDKFFSILAHDLKSPFAGFLGLTKLMTENINDFTIDELQVNSKRMQESADNLYNLLENLLEWSKMKRDSIEFNPEICSLSFLVKQNIEIIFEFAKQKEIEIINNLPNSTFVYADIPMLNGILRNLISNSVKFTKRGGEIEVGLKISGIPEDKSKVSIYIKDNGIGMSDDIKNNLFKIDMKVSRPGTEDELSTGLGLLLCKEFIEKHGEHISVESEVNKGSTFSFSLPAGDYTGADI